MWWLAAADDDDAAGSGGGGCSVAVLLLLLVIALMLAAALAAALAAGVGTLMLLPRWPPTTQSVPASIDDCSGICPSLNAGAQGLGVPLWVLSAVHPSPLAPPGTGAACEGPP